MPKFVQPGHHVIVAFVPKSPTLNIFELIQSPS
jgi:hypothetical protein